LAEDIVLAIYAFHVAVGKEYGAGALSPGKRRFFPVMRRVAVDSYF
jgi:hypothetical protein